MSQRYLIPARKGVAQPIGKGQTLKVINTSGTQVVDFWAFNASDLAECMSMEHSRPNMGKLVPRPGDKMITNKRRPILAVIEDTSPGVHDTLVASCDIYRYRELGHQGHHDNCTDNLGLALEAIGLRRLVHPCPFNLFQNSPVKDGLMSFQQPAGKAGDTISFRMEMDAVVAFSACPQDLIPINGADCIIHDAHFEIA